MKRGRSGDDDAVVVELFDRIFELPRDLAVAQLRDELLLLSDVTPDLRHRVAEVLYSEPALQAMFSSAKEREVAGDYLRLYASSRQMRDILRAEAEMLDPPVAASQKRRRVEGKERETLEARMAERRKKLDEAEAQLAMVREQIDSFIRLAKHYIQFRQEMRHPTSDTLVAAAALMQRAVLAGKITGPDRWRLAHSTALRLHRRATELAINQIVPDIHFHMTGTFRIGGGRPDVDLITVAQHPARVDNFPSGGSKQSATFEVMIDGLGGYPDETFQVVDMGRNYMSLRTPSPPRELQSHLCFASGIFRSHPMQIRIPDASPLQRVIHLRLAAPLIYERTRVEGVAEIYLLHSGKKVGNLRMVLGYYNGYRMETHCYFEDIDTDTILQSEEVRRASAVVQLADFVTEARLPPLAPDLPTPTLEEALNRLWNAYPLLDDDDGNDLPLFLAMYDTTYEGAVVEWSDGRAIRWKAPLLQCAHCHSGAPTWVDTAALLGYCDACKGAQ